MLEIIRDMQAFILFVIGSTFTLALLFTAATPVSQVRNRLFPDLLMESFLIDFGDFSSDEYSPLAQIIFILGVVFVPLILMNMLIAIMGDTYDRVMEDLSRRDLQELASLVYTYLLIRPFLCCCCCCCCCCYCKKKETWKYLWSTSETDESEEEMGWEGRVRGIKRHIDRIDANLEKKLALKIEAIDVKI